ncbi:uncharacterized protein GIQ15_05366 [Arthroderma uncinatum]|uniref:uncharacterized protein n=1 Tax=Arthroderma uncinatum TaxID=74035 RepID=UPI00144AB6B7|nr:uncharacterized protein GIQ15_05366 [Arthroderma uncinatum]KAF3482607.1 hypothetical protein GIQ15_05366 [Arthroderma uncinatum]
MALPTELLLQIIEEALNPSEPYADYHAKEAPVPWVRYSGIPLIFSCKRLYVLGRPIAVRYYTFDISQLPSRGIYLRYPPKPWHQPRYDIFQRLYVRTDILFDPSWFIERVTVTGQYYKWKEEVFEVVDGACPGFKVPRVLTHDEMKLKEEYESQEKLL